MSRANSQPALFDESAEGVPMSDQSGNGRERSTIERSHSTTAAGKLATPARGYGCAVRIETTLSRGNSAVTDLFSAVIETTSRVASSSLTTVPRYP